MDDAEKALVAKELRKTSPEYLGREHFLVFGDIVGSTKLARTSFGILTVRKTFPKDARKPDLETLGLVIINRTDTDLGRIPDFAKMDRGGQTYLQERLAIGSISLKHLMEDIRYKSIQCPRGFGEGVRRFLFGLVAEVSPDRPTWS